MTARKLKDGLRGANQAEAIVLVAVVRVVVVPVSHGTVGSIVVPRAAARVLFTKLGKLCVFYAVRTRRRTGLYLFIRT